MIDLNDVQKKAINGMVQRANLTSTALTNADIDFFNANYGEENANVDQARFADISKKIKELMMVDLDSAEILKDAYVTEYNSSKEDLAKLDADANMSGLKKVFFGGRKKRAKARKAVIADKGKLLKDRKEFDKMYNDSLNEVVELYGEVINDSQIASVVRPGLEHMITSLGFSEEKKDVQDGKTLEERKLEFLKEDKASVHLNKLKKLTYYSEMDRNYRERCDEFDDKYVDKLKTGWIKRDIVGYCCKTDRVDKSSADCFAHAKNLDIICVEKKASPELMAAIYDEVSFLKEQQMDIERWKNEHAALFTEKLPDGLTALKNYTAIQRAFKKMQISTTAIKAIRKTCMNLGLKDAVADYEEFENETAPYIMAMHSYVKTVTVIASRHLDAINGRRVDQADLRTWDETLAIAKEHAKDEVKD